MSEYKIMSINAAMDLGYLPHVLEEIRDVKAADSKDEEKAVSEIMTEARSRGELGLYPWYLVREKWEKMGIEDSPYITECRWV